MSGNKQQDKAGTSGYAAYGSRSDQRASQLSYSAEIERQRKERESKDLRVMHQGRNILNLAANIRNPVWNTDEKLRDLKSNRSIAQRLNEQQRTEDQTSSTCPSCKFRQPKPFLY
ncbi:uncharacterized protein LOC116849654 isoform X2 [Odontomachus brunneus]|uniref:uncharacterized protein LOC116849654 isoform X2 n=1 Tax=Odontomachus brunneus TaxID=486640 RepID=UPI0013F23231|nr:uncharacterized protein LOC116849654 isoform X2 [Odontomachus brunneus]